MTPHEKYMIAYDWLIANDDRLDAAAREMHERTGWRDQLSAAAKETFSELPRIGQRLQAVAEREWSGVSYGAPGFAGAYAVAAALGGLVHKCPHATPESLLAAPTPLVFIPRAGMLTCKSLLCRKADPVDIVPPEECDLCRAVVGDGQFTPVCATTSIYTVFAEVCDACVARLRA